MKTRCLATAILLLSAVLAPATDPPSGLPVLPGTRPPRQDPSLAGPMRRVDPLADGWPSEAFAEAAETQLAALGRLLAAGTPVDPSGAARLASPGFRGGSLRPASMKRVFGGAALTVARGEVPDARTHRGPEGLAAALADLLDFLKAPGGVRAEWLVHRVDPASGSAGTTAWVHLDGAGEGGVVESTATWRMEWTLPSPQAPPLLSSIEVGDFEVVTRPGAGPLYGDATMAALGASPAFRRLLLPGVDHWLARVEGWIESDGFGHHGIAVGDVNGDGLEDLYVCQMGGLPNLLFVQNPDGTLTDRSAEAGVDWLERTRSALLVDLDNDGDQDLVAATSVSLLFMANDGAGRFTVKASLSASGNIVADSDQLGATSAAGMKVGGGQDGGHYYRGPDIGGVRTSDLVMLAAADYDGDGDLDIYACAYHAASEEADRFPIPMPYHDANNGGRNILLRNDGEWRFADATGSAGLDVNNRRFSFAASWEDYDNDGDPDLYVANDFGRKNLYRNEAGRFTDVAAAAGVEDVGAGMSASWADYDGDGWMDLYVGNMFSAAGSRVAWHRQFKPRTSEDTRSLYQRHARGNSLFRNVGDGTFRDVTLQAAVNMGRWAWSSSFVDFDNDGAEDILVANGYFTRPDPRDLSSFFWRQVVMGSPDMPIPPETARSYEVAWQALGRMIRQGRSFAGAERNCAFQNTGGARFATVSSATGLDLIDDARALAATDHDLDGDLDVWVASRTGPRVRLMLNGLRDGRDGGRPGRARFVAVKLEGRKANRDAIGARLELVTSGASPRRLIRSVRAGDGYLAQSSKWVHFGLGEASGIARLIVRWPGGSTEELTGLAPDQRYRIVEGSGVAEPWSPPRGPVTLATAPLAVTPPEDRARIFLSAPVPAPTLAWEGFDGKPAAPTGPSGEAILVTLWTAACPGCEEQLAELSRRAGELATKGVRVVALTADGLDGEGPRDLSAARGVAARVSPTLTTGAATAAFVDKMQLLQGKVLQAPSRFPVPVSFLIDADGLLGAIYKGPLPFEDLMADVAALRTSGERRLSRAIPSPGRRQTRGWPSFFDYMDQVAQVYAGSGYPEEAVEYYRKVLRIKPGSVQASFSLGTALAGMGRIDEAIGHYRTALENDPNHAAAMNNLGYALAGQGKLDEAIGLYRRSLSVDPLNVSAWSNLGAALAEQGKIEEAIGAYRKALEIEPDNAPALNNVAVALARQGNDPEAIAHYEKLLALDAANVPAHLNLGMALLRQGRRQEATDHFREAARLKPDQPESHYHLGLALAGEGKPEEAARSLEEAVRLRPGYTRALYHLGLVLARQGRIDEGIGRLGEAMQVPPGSPAAADRLAWVLATSQDPQQRDGRTAVSVAEKVCQVTGNAQAGPLDTLAAAYAEAGRFTEAVSTARRAADLAMAGGETERADRIRQRLRLYESGRPFREGQDAPR